MIGKRAIAKRSRNIREKKAGWLKTFDITWYWVQKTLQKDCVKSIYLQKLMVHYPNNAKYQRIYFDFFLPRSGFVQQII